MADFNLDDQAIFEVARKIEPGEARQAYLRQVCSEDPELEGRVQALLQAYEQSESVLEAPPPEVVGRTASVDYDSLERPGAEIGPFKLLQKTGEGGMGVVYAAEQKEPIKRLAERLHTQRRG